MAGYPGAFSFMAKLNPYDPSELDKQYLARLTELMQKWLRARNGQPEDVNIQMRAGINPYGRTISFHFAVQVTKLDRPDGIISPSKM